MFRTLAQAVPDMSWLTPVVNRAILAIQLFLSAVIALPLLKTWGGATTGGMQERAKAKEETGERAMWFVAVWLVGGVVMLLNWVIGR